MLLLAIESAGPAASVALLDRRSAPAGELAAFRTLPPGREQADRLIELVDGVLGDAGIHPLQLEFIAVGTGPGTFTGVRTAVAAARGLALATGRGVMAVSSLEALACAALQFRPATIVAALDARRGEVYAQAFADDLRPLGEPTALPPEAAARSTRGPMVLVGSGARLVQAALPGDAESEILPVELDARAVALCAARKLRAGMRPAPGFTVRPLYLRAPDARPQHPRPALARMAAPLA